MPNLLVHLFLPHESNNQRAKLLHPSSLVAILIVFVLFQLGIGRLALYHPQILGYAAQISPDEIVRLTNSRRQEKGLNTLQMNGELSAAASSKAADMVARGYWAHVSPNGTQPWYFITNAGYQYRYAGENLARDFSDAGSIVQAWMDSPTHRDNLLSSRYKDIGVAVVDGQLDGRDTTLVVQMFGTQLSAAPSTTSTRTAVVPKVKAAEEPSPSSALAQAIPTPVVTTATVVAPTVTNTTTPFDITKAVSLALLAVFIVVLVIDVAAVHKRKITRWTSKSLAHLAFLLILLLAAILVNQGVIL
ncbi:MAG: CAP domain-containing protein [bacterium]|nr:CAP domain-containing protein [bacterium]